VTFTIGSASLEDITNHLVLCDRNFKPALSERGSIKEYAAKIATHAVRFEAWENNRLVGLVAAYLNDYKEGVGFITNVSVEAGYLGKGIAKQLLQNCIEYALTNEFKFIRLEVFDENIPAIQLYRKLNFLEIKHLDRFVVMQVQIPARSIIT
jgi:ribosomal protein S18 acetylase RimI-like enzyme